MKTTFLRLSVLLFFFPAMLPGCTKDAALQNPAASLSADDASLSAPENLTVNRYKTYTIEQGNHYANGRHFIPFSGDTLSFTAIFDSSAIYNFTDPNTKYDQNTLYGFADNNAFHRDFSARFGWRWFNNKLQIAAYTFNFSDSTIIEMGAVPLNKASKYSIVVSGDHYDFTLNKKTLSLPRYSTTPTAGLYKLLPYFGGDATAQQQVTIRIKEH